MTALLAIVLPLGLDTFALALALGAAGLTTGQRLRVGVILTAFEAGMPLVGLALGRFASNAISSDAQLVAGIALVVLGVAMLRGEDEGEQRARGIASAHGLAVLALGVSISLDELAVGFTFGLIHVDAPLAVVLIATQALLVAQIGMRLGTRVNEAWGERAEALAGVAIAAYGAYLLAQTWG